jgi:hypothetical protein
MAGMSLPTVAIPKTVMLSESEEEEQPQKKRKQTVLPCDDARMATLAGGGKFRWAACECIVFEWAVNDPMELANTERGNLFIDACKSKEELL